MAKEEELKSVDLKVNVSCCDGCRRKVMKAMSVEGVLRTEIHPSLDRVTVVGDVDGRVLARKLAKIGKIAEVVAAAEEHGKGDEDGRSDRGRPAWSAPPEEHKKRGEDDWSDRTRPASAEEKIKRRGDGKSSKGDKAAAATTAEKKKDCSKCTHQHAARGGGSADRGKAPPASVDTAAAAAESVEELDVDVFAGATAPSAPEHHVASSHQHYYHRAESPTMAVPVHMPPYHAAASVTPYYYYGGYFGVPPPPTPMTPPPPHAPPPPQQLRPPQPSRFDVDYFDDDDAVGCRVM